MSIRAVLAAINDYGNPQNNLPSCLADLAYVQRILRETYRVPSRNIKVLTDGQVTRSALSTALTWLCKEQGPDETLLFYFSGHGFQLAVGPNLEECLVLSDGYFMDDELVAASRNAKPHSLTVVLDSCFGGGGNKTIFSPSGTGAGERIIPKRFRPTDPEDFGEGCIVQSYKPFCRAPITQKSALSTVSSPSGTSLWPTAIDEIADPELQGVLLAACLEDETASASTSFTEGLSAFTWALKSTLERTGPKISVSRLRDETDRLIKDRRLRQTPTLSLGASGLKETAIFLTLETEPQKPQAAGMNAMSDKGLLDAVVETIVREAVRELTKNSSPVSTSDKSILGADAFVPVFVDTLIEGLSRKKGYTPATASSANSKWFPGAEIIIPIIVDRVVDEITRKGYTPLPVAPATKLFPGADIILPALADVIIREITQKGYTLTRA